MAPLPPTSEKPQYSAAYRNLIHINMLDHDSLVNIFNHCRLGNVDNWNRQHTWCKLAHVCRRWRYLIYDSLSLLDMCLLITNGSPPMDLLAHLPPMPLVIECENNITAWVRPDEENVYTGLQHPDRLRRVVLQGPSPSLRTCLIALNELFPRLEYLSIESTMKEEASLVLPSTFRAPNLRHLAFHDIGLPVQLSLSASTNALVTLTITHIAAPCYFHPKHLVMQLRDLPYLEELSIGFAVPIPRPPAVDKLLPAPIPRVTLPILKRFTFRGVVVYLENLIAQIYTPLLEQLDVTLLFQLTFALVNLNQFVHSIERLRCHSARVLFRRSCTSMVTSNGDPQDGGGLTISVICEPLDWQIDSTTQVCGALAQVLSSIEELTLDLEAGIPFDGENGLDSTLWHGLLLPFGGVRRLHIDSALTSELSDALKHEAAGMVLELLPHLQDIEVQLEIDDAYNAFSTFIETRERGGRLVHLLALPTTKASSKMSPYPIDLFDYISDGDSTPPSHRDTMPLRTLDFGYQFSSVLRLVRSLRQRVTPEVSPLAVPSTRLGMLFTRLSHLGTPFKNRPHGQKGPRGPRGSRQHSDFAQSIARNRKLRKRHGYRR